MELTEILLVIENDKGTEKNLLMNFTEYMLQFGSRVEKTPMEAALHTLDLERTRMDNEVWTELYFAANKSVHARYCSGLEQLSNFLAGAHNDGYFGEFGYWRAICIYAKVQNERKR